MGRFVQGEDRRQQTMLPVCLDDYIPEDNPVRAVDAFIDELDLAALGFERVQPAAAGRPAYHPATLLKILSTAISIVSSRAVGWSARQGAISS
jgi:transposase